MIVENIIPRNLIINLGCASVDNHIPRDDIFDYHPRRECNIYILSYDVASGSEITPCNKIDKPLVVYRFTGNVMASIITLRT